jgi:Bacterial Ig domain
VIEVHRISADDGADTAAESTSRTGPVADGGDGADDPRTGPVAPGLPPWGSALGAIITASVLAALYFLFVLHYSVNFLVEDDWGLVPIIHAALHSHLTLGLLWAQHNENRMLVPRLVIVGSALVHDYDSRSIILLGAFLFIVSYGLLLAAFRTYLGRSLTPLHAVSLGIVWFSLEDTENALWAFQLAWNMIVFFLMTLLFLLLKDWRHRNVVLTLAIVSAIAASFSSLQGLILWPVGLICLVWDQPQTRRRNVECTVWIAFGALTTATYFRGYALPFTGPSRSPAFALHHPVEMAQFFLATLGNVIATTSTDLGAHELLGLAVFVIAIFVVVRCVLDRASRAHTALPVALIVFGVLFDASIALGRVGLGVAAALVSRYTMANLIVLTGIGVFAWAHVRPWKEARGVGLRGIVERAGIVLLAAFLVIQCAAATNVGVNAARKRFESQIVGARTVVNLDEIPAPQAQRLVSLHVYPSLAVLSPYLQEAKEDHLSVFAPGPYYQYQSMGPPISSALVTCSSISGDNHPGQRLELSGCTGPTGHAGAIAAPFSDSLVIHWSGGGISVVTIKSRLRSALTCPHGWREVTLKGNVKGTTIPGANERFGAALCSDSQGHLTLVPGTKVRFSGVPIPVANPTTTILLPSKGATISGTATLDASASLNTSATNVTSVRFYLFGNGYFGLLIGTGVSTPYGWIASWNTQSVRNASYVLVSKAFSRSTSGTSPPETVKVHN